MKNIFSNPANIFILIILTIIIGAVIRYMIREKKAGRKACGCSCQDCTAHGSCSETNRQDH